MKKLFLLLVMVFSLCGSVGAQKGMNGIGANFSVNGGIGIGASIKYQYNVSDFFRLEPSFSYYSVEDDAFEMTALMNAHVFFCSPRSIRPYFFTGIGYAKFQEEHKFEPTEYKTCFGINGGFGLDWRITHKFSVQIEAGALLGVGDDNMIGVRGNIGFCYNF